MKYTKDDLLAYLSNYNDDELFYKEVYLRRKQSKESFSQYLATLNKDYLLLHDLYVPEFFPNNEFFTCRLLENKLFFKIPGDIKISKHNRYSPAFLHEHEYIEILYIYSGSCSSTIQNRDFELHTGDLCIIPQNTSHSVAIYDDSIALNIMIRSQTFQNTFYTIFDSENILTHFFSHILNNHTFGNYLIFHTSSDPDIRSAIETMFIEYLEHEKYSSSILRNYLSYFWGILLRHHETHITSFLTDSETTIPIAAIMNYMNENYHSLTLSDVATHFGFNVSYFSTLLKKITGKTFSQLIKEIKLTKAQYALEHTELTIDSICEIVGYNNKEHFMRTFKKNFHITPGEYRKQFRPY